MGHPDVEQGLVDLAVELATGAGALTRKWFDRGLIEFDTKDDGTPVTEADKAAEKYLRDQIALAFPTDAVIGEEGETREGTSGRTWIIDPIDGTKSFTAGVPLYANLLAVIDDGEPVLGIINLPAVGEMLAAVVGHGATCNDEPIRVSSKDSLRGAYVMTSSVRYWPQPFQQRVLDEAMVLRTWGDAYGYAMVATGRAEAMIDPRANVWDVAPIGVILTEAGGAFTDLAGNERVNRQRDRHQRRATRGLPLRLPCLRLALNGALRRHLRRQNDQNRSFRHSDSEMRIAWDTDLVSGRGRADNGSRCTEPASVREHGWVIEGMDEGMDEFVAGPAFLTHWAALASELDLAPEAANDVGFDLAACHTEPHRHYHTMDHITAVLCHLEDLHSSTPVARLAAFFHDAVYDPTRSDNEEQSAELAHEVLTALDRPEADDVAAIVRATAKHELPTDAPRETAAFLDADLAILGARAEVYDTYAANIRAEYAHIADDDFRTGRRTVLEGFLSRDRLFFTTAGQAKFEAAARGNLRREIQQLSTP